MKRICLLLLSLILVISMLAGCEQPPESTAATSTASSTTTTTAVAADPVIKQELFAGSGSYESLLAIISQAIATGQYRNNLMVKTFGAPERSSDSALGTQSATAATGNYSTTNIQVAGVDEADIIKTDGRYLYYLANNRLYIVDAGSDQPQVIYTKYFNPSVKDGNKTSGESPVELFLDTANKRLVVILSGYLNENIPIETKPIETKPIETKPVETKPVETKPVETRTPETKPVASTGSSGAATPSTTAAGTVVKPAPDQVSSSTASGSSGSAGSADPASGNQGVSSAMDIVGKVDSRMIAPYYNSKQYTITRVYQLDDPKNPKLVRQFTQEGGYLTARLVAGYAYVLSNKYEYRYYAGGPATQTEAALSKDILPKTSEDPVNGPWNVIAADRIGIVPGADPNAQLIVSAISVTKDAQKPELLSLLGASGIVYASQDHIYVANYAYEYNQKQPELSKSNMKIYRIGIAGGKVVADGIGTVPGTVINQFAMDEYKGYFRIATTDSGSFWGRTTTNSSSTVYVLDKNLKTVGQVGKLGPGETIRSVRFMGDRAYVVTFQTTDPLYVLDLQSPTAPKVLGELKIPGFSSYLHPYGENLLLGIGFDAVVQGNSAYQTSLKVSLFDVSDVSKPKELSTILLGGRGSYSEVAQNHKALLFSKEKNLIAFPATLTGQNGSPKEDGGLLFQGLVVMMVENGNKLVLRGGLTNAKKLTSLTGNGIPYNQITKEDQMALSGYDSITRGLYIGDRLITLSSRLIRQYSLTSLKPLGETTLKGFNEYYGYTVNDGIAMPAMREGVAVAD